MSKLTIFFGVILILIGVVGYLGTGRHSVTALIPAFIGLPIIISGWVGLRPGREKTTCLVAAIITLVGLGGCVPGLLKLAKLLTGEEITRPAAVYLQTLMAIVSIIYLIWAICYLLSPKNRS